MITIAPSILSADFANLGRDCKLMRDSGADFLHFDVMDGVFVPNISVGLPVLQSLSTCVDSVMDVHLMITKPQLFIEQFAKAGADYITFHIESDCDAEAVIKQIHACGKKAGISLRPGTDIAEIMPFVPLVEMVLIMSVEPGFGGQSFMPQATERIAAIARCAQEKKPKLLISVDGGINADTGTQCKNAGANVLVTGSYLFGKGEKTKQLISELSNN